MKKDLMRGTAFLLVLACILGVLNYLYTPKRLISGSSTAFYQSLPEDTVDVIYTGASGMGTGVVPTEIWAQNGITGYNISTSVQMSITTYYTFQEALLYQTPKVLVIDAGMLMRGNNVDSTYFEPSLRKAITAMSWSKPKADAVKDILSRSEKQTSPYSYYIALLGFHTRWGAIKEKSPAKETAKFLGNFNYTKVYELPPLEAIDIVGFVSDSDAAASPIVVSAENAVSVSSTDINSELLAEASEGVTVNETSAEYFEKIIALCKERGITVVVEKNPSPTWSYEKHCAVSDFCDAHGVDFIDLNMSEYLSVIDLDYSADFHDTVHLNISGAQKVSRVLGNILAESYGLHDKRGTAGYEIYDEYAEEYLAYIDGLTVSGSDA